MAKQFFHCDAVDDGEQQKSAVSFYIEASDLKEAFKLAGKKGVDVLNGYTSLKVSEIKPQDHKDLPGQTKMDGT